MPEYVTIQLQRPRGGEYASRHPPRLIAGEQLGGRI